MNVGRCIPCMDPMGMFVFSVGTLCCVDTKCVDTRRFTKKHVDGPKFQI